MSYPMPIPIADEVQIAKAVRQMATYPGDVQAARRRIIKRAHEIDAEYLIPSDWNEDGTVT